MDQQKLLSRINYSGNITDLLSTVCRDYQLGSYVAHTFTQFGYEDLNIILNTSKGKYFVKLFLKDRSKKVCRRYIDIMNAVINAGIPYPQLYQSPQGSLHTLSFNNAEIYLCVMEYIDGKNFFQLKRNLTVDEMKYLIHQTVKINTLPLKPSFLYDSWATINFVREYNKKHQHLIPKENKLVCLLVNDFSKVAIKELPHCFVHGDIIKTNVMKDRNGRIYILDFAVANYYPRITELAVLLCNMFFDEAHPTTMEKLYQFTINEYQKDIPLEKVELALLPLFIKATFAMYILSSTYEKKVNNNRSEENEYWLKVGRAGLFYSSDLWR